jgi:gamma-glutamylcyclotransferase (GGCT)/AIG2-like uncharacterized protein YtfP
MHLFKLDYLPSSTSTNSHTEVKTSGNANVDYAEKANGIIIRAFNELQNLNGTQSQRNSVTITTTYPRSKTHTSSGVLDLFGPLRKNFPSFPVYDQNKSIGENAYNKLKFALEKNSSYPGILNELDKELSEMDVNDLLKHLDYLESRKPGYQQEPNDIQNGHKAYNHLKTILRDVKKSDGPLKRLNNELNYSDITDLVKHLDYLQN